jgi:sensor histidine kinase regulating citrate/malate metabolism
MISNSIQAYNGKINENINLIINKIDDTIIFSIEDFAGGLPEKVRRLLRRQKSPL